MSMAEPAVKGRVAAPESPLRQSRVSLQRHHWLAPKVPLGVRLCTSGPLTGPRV